MQVKKLKNWDDVFTTAPIVELWERKKNKGMHIWEGFTEKEEHEVTNLNEKISEISINK